MTKGVLTNLSAGAGAGGPVGSTAISTASGGVSIACVDLCALARRLRATRLLARAALWRRGARPGQIAE